MTTSSWTTSADIPPAAWAAMAADMRRLLAVTAAGGAKLAGPTGSGAPILNEDVIGFTVTAPQSQPLSVTFHRAAGEGEVVTNAPHTDGLVLATLQRATRHWGPLVTVRSDAGTTSRAVAEHLVEGLFDVDDRALSGDLDAPTPANQVRAILTRAHAIVAEQEGAGELSLAAFFDAVIAEIAAERQGLTVAGTVLTPPAKP